MPSLGSGGDPVNLVAETGTADAAKAAASEWDARDWELDDLLDAYHRQLERETNR